jgi:hypothetical protein
MRERRNSRGRLVHLMAGIALGAAVVLVAWISAGGQPFGRIVGSADVSAPTSASTEQTAVERRAGSTAARSVRLRSKPPELVRAPELRFMTPKRKAARKPRHTARARRAAKRKRTSVVRVVSPPSSRPPGEVAEAPVAVVPAPAPAAVPAPPAPAPSGGGKPRVKPPRAPSYESGAGEG